MAKTGDYVEGLEEMVRFFKAYPELEMVDALGVNNYVVDRGRLAEWARALAAESGKVDKDMGDTFVTLKHKFGALIQVDTYVYRKDVCTPKVVGKKRVLVKRPVKWEEEEVEQDVLEYDCGSLLAEDSAPVVDADFAEVADTVGEHLAGAEQEF